MTHSPAPVDSDQPAEAPHLDLRALRVFVLLADGLTFRQAAAELHLDPSHATKLVQRLERSLDAQLLARTSRRSELTAAGWAALAPARQLLGAAVSLASAVAGAQTPRSTRRSSGM